MKKRHSLGNQKGFTLIELISVMIILGVMGSVAIRKYDNLTNTANERVLAVTVKERKFNLGKHENFQRRVYE
jgi:prepilin-type N-terminal cleavage/methylation domain-containing protein